MLGSAVDAITNMNETDKCREIILESFRKSKSWSSLSDKSSILKTTCYRSIKKKLQIRKSREFGVKELKILKMCECELCKSKFTCV